jgi:hypothetical protein
MSTTASLFSVQKIQVNKLAFGKQYDSLIVIDLEDVTSPNIYMYFEVENLDYRYFTSTIYINKMDKNAGRYLILQVKSGETYYFSNYVEYHVSFGNRTYYTKVPFPEDTLTKVEPGRIYYLGKVKLDLAFKDKEYVFDKDEANYKEVLKTIIAKYSNKNWKAKAQEILKSL